MLERKRERKKIYPPQPPVPLAIAGGEATISKDHLRIKMPSQPPLGDFKTRSYLNYTASIPLRFNKATGYYEPAEIYEEVRANKYGYFYVAEPTPLTDSGWADGRINKRRHSMVSVYDEDGRHLNFIPFPTYRGIIIGGSELMETFGEYNRLFVGSYGEVMTKAFRRHYTLATLWENATVPDGAVSSYFGVGSVGIIGVFIKVSSPTSVIVETQPTSGYWYEHTTITFTEAGSRAQDIMSSAWAMRFRVTKATTITIQLIGKT